MRMSLGFAIMNGMLALGLGAVGACAPSTSGVDPTGGASGVSCKSGSLVWWPCPGGTVGSGICGDDGASLLSCTCGMGGDGMGEGSQTGRGGATGTAGMGGAGSMSGAGGMKDTACGDVDEPCCQG